MNFNLDNYEPVKERITRFYADHKEGRIITELISSPETLDKSATFKASIFLGEILKATGYAYETPGQGANKDAWVENAETSAIGRALANMDYCGDLRPSKEEMSKATASSTSATTMPSGSGMSFKAFTDLVDEVVPQPEQVDWKRKANGGRDEALNASLATEIRARYTGKQGAHV